MRVGTADAGDNQWHFAANESFYLYDDIVPLVHALRNASFLNFTRPTLPFVAGQMLHEVAPLLRTQPSAARAHDSAAIPPCALLSHTAGVLWRGACLRCVSGWTTRPTRSAAA